MNNDHVFAILYEKGNLCEIIKFYDDVNYDNAYAFTRSCMNVTN